ncbi:hypothetical protein HK100_000444 [Physocladia obscura]|uniref:Uncharacterized protein n=1 Tax=Physocladia obscura TaxID=109957 RepID=A0AAD5XKD9_9FUNG|nr:hypothetical protein HK100_000444 [Physocladia obscura]
MSVKLSLRSLTGSTGINESLTVQNESLTENHNYVRKKGNSSLDFPSCSTETNLRIGTRMVLFPKLLCFYKHIGLRNCAIHLESQHHESAEFLETFKTLRYSGGNRFAPPLSLSKNDESTTKIPPAPPKNPQQPPLPSLFHLPYPKEDTPRLFRIHNATRVRANAAPGTVIIECIPLSRNFQTAVTPSDENENDEDENKPLATTLPESYAGRGILPVGWKIWDCCTGAERKQRDFVPVSDAVYVFEGVGFMWIFGCEKSGNDKVGFGGSAVVSTVAVKVDSGLSPHVNGNLTNPEVSGQTVSVIRVGGGSVTNNSDKSDLDTERCMGLAWAREVALARGHGKIETFG